MVQTIFKKLSQELRKGASEYGHPFRYFALGTFLNSDIRLRTVVLRDVDTHLNCTFYTDLRSKKITHIRSNSKVSLLLYHPQSFLQLHIEGIAKIEENVEVLQYHWNKISSKGRKEYSTTSPPGDILKDSSDLSYFEDSSNFAIITVQPITIEYLQLQQPHHIRVLYTRTTNGWDGDFLVP